MVLLVLLLVLEWTEGEEVTSGENLYGEVGGVATGDFSFLHTRRIQLFLPVERRDTTYWYLMMFLLLFCLASFRLRSSWSPCWVGEGRQSPSSHIQGSARQASRKEASVRAWLTVPSGSWN